MGTHPIFESDFDCLTECQPLKRKPSSENAKVIKWTNKAKKKSDPTLRRFQPRKWPVGRRKRPMSERFKCPRIASHRSRRTGRNSTSQLSSSLNLRFGLIKRNDKLNFARQKRAWRFRHFKRASILLPPSFMVLTLTMHWPWCDWTSYFLKHFKLKMSNKR